ncbi:SSU ribosomal protein S2p (SAe) [hydrothermal vent metagenome]|uniref:SSU ribosomal protein S2p (SAe) n=1 Tax=hydrothermal vent metagenome TaxID=652676 RepID=A0A3B1AGF8_9ZZZZ
MALPTFTMRQLLEAGVHFGHQSHRWNPKMKEYIFGARNKVHILNLSITVPLLHRALETVRDVTASGGRVLFVGTKRQASGPIAEAAKRCGQYYVNHRWLGGMMTNWETISKSIKRLKELDAKLSEDIAGLTKKEILQMTRERDKLERALGGIKDMGGIPNVLFVIDTNKEELAIQEANKLGIPVVAILDSNSNPDNVTFPIPGNDDATRAIQLYCDLISGAVLDGIQQELVEQGVDVGAAVEAPVVEELAPEAAPVEETVAPEAAPEAAAPESAAVETAPVEEAAQELKKEVKVKAKASK